ncbi:MAG: AraC family transcriptional regulator [Roseobacter sp.]
MAQSARFTSAHYRRVLAFIRARLDQTVTVDELAREAGMSASHLTRGFNETLGSTPMQYVLAYRVEQARKMLEGPRAPWARSQWNADFPTRRISGLVLNS